MKFPRQWLQDRFFKGFLATMVLKGHNAVETFESEHQRRFDRVASRLNTLQHDDESGALAQLPRSFVRSSITGAYKDLDDALIGLQNGLLSAQNPYYVSVSINCSKDLASQIVDAYSPQEREFFEVLVDTWTGEDSLIA